MLAFYSVMCKLRGLETFSDKIRTGDLLVLSLASL